MFHPTTATLDCQAYTYEYQADELPPLDYYDTQAPFDFDLPTDSYFDRLYDERRAEGCFVGTFGHPACPEW